MITQYKHPLKSYLEKEKYTLSQFVRENDLSYQSLSAFLHGKRLPSYQMIYRIELATKGKVSGEEMVKWTYRKYISSIRFD